MIHSFLLIGQSNAAGRGSLKEALPLNTNKGKLKVLRNGRWQTMYRPVNCDRGFSGTCLAESFAKAYSDEYAELEVGIIPCADGGTSLDQWAPGGLLFDNAVNCARLAMRTSKLVGVLWHQGEADCSSDRYPLYREKFNAIKEAMRRELGLPSLPFVLGGLGDFLAACDHSEHLKNFPYVNEALRLISEEDENCAFAEAHGLTSNPDKLHFSAAALYEFGLRYYEAFGKIAKIDFGAENETLENDSERTAMELL